MEYFNKINELIKADGYELYESKIISKRSLYAQRSISIVESQTGKFAPFSIIHKKTIENKTLNLTISKKIRTEIASLFNRYNDSLDARDEHGLTYTTTLKEVIIGDIRDFYTPKAFNSDKKNIETDSIDDFIMNNHPYCVFDSIQLFGRYNKESNFTNEVIKEVGLKELIEQATTLYCSTKFVQPLLVLIIVGKI